MNKRFKIRTHQDKSEVIKSVNSLIGKSQGLFKIKFDGHINENQLKLDSFTVPVIQINGVINSEENETILDLVVNSSDTKFAIKSFLNTCLIIAVTVISILKIISAPTSFFSYLLIPILIIIGFILKKIIFIWAYYINGYGNQAPEAYVDTIRRVVEGKYA